MLDVPGGGHVRLGDVASVQIGPYPTVIKHDNVSRSLDVTASVRGRDLATVVDEVRARVHAMAMPLEFHAEVHSDTLQKQGLFWRVGVRPLRPRWRSSYCSRLPSAAGGWPR